MVVTALTRNQVVMKVARGFESLLLRHMNLEILHLLKGGGFFNSPDDGKGTRTREGEAQGILRIFRAELALKVRRNSEKSEKRNSRIPPPPP